jgi:predicted ABC-type ATPase
MVAADASSALSARPDERRQRDAAALGRHLAGLPDAHPSSRRYAADSGDAGRANSGDGSRIRPLSDAEHVRHVAEARARIEQARAYQSTDVRHTIDDRHWVWSYQRRLEHDDLVDSLLSGASGVRCDRSAILAGGIAGAGKTTVLTEHAGIDLPRYLMINPDSIKEEMGRRGLIPQVRGLTPMEASELAHEESSHLAKRLAHRAQAEGMNIIWDVTMAKADSGRKRIAELRAGGYHHLEGIFVDISVDVSLRRTEARYRDGHESYRTGDGPGGRLVPPELILGSHDDRWGTANRRNFEEIKDQFDAWRCYDNSVDGCVPRLVAASSQYLHERTVT